MGVLIDDPVSIVDVETSIKNIASYNVLKKDDAKEMLKMIETYRAQHGEPPDTDEIALDLNSILEPTIWLKPVGYRDNPIVEGEDFSAERDDLHFARRPASVSVWDKVIAYGVGIGYGLDVLHCHFRISANSR